MPVTLEEIQSRDLTQTEKDSILAHAIDLHLIGSDEAEHVGFDIIAQKETNVKHLLRIKHENQHVGVIYLFPLGNFTNHLEMTILVHEPFRGRHFTAEAVGQVESMLAAKYPSPISLCATVQDHNPMRKELTNFLLKHSYHYEPQHSVFIKKIR